MNSGKQEISDAEDLSHFSAEKSAGSTEEMMQAIMESIAITFGTESADATSASEDSNH